MNSAPTPTPYTGSFSWAAAVAESQLAVDPPDDRPLLWCDWPPLGQCAQVAEQAFLSGWALAARGEPLAVEVQAGRTFRAHHGLHRLDVELAHPGVPLAALSGWLVRLPVRGWHPGTYEIGITARCPGGRPTTLTRYVAVDPDGIYAAWQERRSLVLPGHEAGQQLVGRRPDAPQIGVILVDGDDGARTARTMRSLQAQIYPRWAVLETTIDAGLSRLVDSDLGAAVVVRAGDVVRPHALFELATRLIEAPAPSIIYSDHDLSSGTDRSSRPFFKPEWSPELLLSTDYIGPFICVGRDAARLALATEPRPIDCTYDLLTRLVDERLQVVRVPDVLCGLDPERPRPGPNEAQRHVAAVAQRRRKGVRLHHVPGTNGNTVRWQLEGEPLVSIVIATTLRNGFIDRCLSSLRSRTTYPKIEVVLVVNGVGDGRAQLPDLDGLSHRVVDFDGPFNYSAINNAGAAAASGEMLVFLNDDTEVESPDWIEALLEQVQQPGVGVAGAHLVFPDGVRQMTGVVLTDSNDCAVVTGMGTAADDPGYQGLAGLTRNTTAVAGACMLITRDLFDTLGGFDEALPVELNDIDICLRAQTAGQRVVLTPNAVLRHHYRGSRGATDHPSDHSRFRYRWRHLLRSGDPFYSPNLSTVLETEYEPYTGRRPPLRPLVEQEEPHYESEERFVPELMPGVIQAEHEGRYRWASRAVGGKDVLDAGCGVGYGTLILARAGAARAVGMDIAAEAVADARFRAGHAAHFVRGDLRSLPMAGASFDVVTCFEAIEHVEDQDRVLDELRRVLRPDGVLIVSSPNRGIYAPGNPYHVHEYTAAELRAAVTARFAHVAMIRQSLWSASLLTDDSGFTESDSDHELVAALRKTAGADPGDEIYTIAVASDGPLPDLGRLAVLCEAPDLEGWQKTVADLERRVRELDEGVRELEDGIRHLADERAKVTERLEAVESSSSWRLAKAMMSASSWLRGRGVSERGDGAGTG